MAPAWLEAELLTSRLEESAMRAFLLALLFSSLVVLAGLAADDHSNATEKKAWGEIEVSEPVKVADQTLPAARYHISCDRETLTFEALGKNKKFTFPCKGKKLEAKAQTTELYMDLGGKERVVQKLLLRGSNVEHTF